MSEADGLVLTHKGSHTGSTLDFEYTPVNSHIGGSSTTIVGSSGQKLSITNHRQNSFEFEFLDVSKDLRPGESVTEEVDTTIEYGRNGEKEADVTLEIRAENHGKGRVIASDNYLFPKTQSARRALEQRYKKNRRAANGEPKIREHQDAYEYVPPKEGEDR